MKLLLKPLVSGLQENNYGQNDFQIIAMVGGSDGTNDISRFENHSKHYFKPSDRPGTLEILNYPTFESFFPTRQTPQFQLKKEAVIYLPYGYSDQQKNIQWFILVMVVGPMNAQPWDALILPMPSNTLWITRLQMEKLPQLSLLIHIQQYQSTRF